MFVQLYLIQTSIDMTFHSPMLYPHITVYFIQIAKRLKDLDFLRYLENGAIVWCVGGRGVVGVVVVRNGKFGRIRRGYIKSTCIHSSKNVASKNGGHIVGGPLYALKLEGMVNLTIDPYPKDERGKTDMYPLNTYPMHGHIKYTKKHRGG